MVVLAVFGTLVCLNLPWHNPKPYLAEFFCILIYSRWLLLIFFHIIQNHPFIDGNKRVGAVAALVFLEINNKAINMTNDELEFQVLSVAQGLTDKTASAKFFREHAV